MGSCRCPFGLCRRTGHATRYGRTTRRNRADQCGCLMEHGDPALRRAATAKPNQVGTRRTLASPGPKRASCSTESMRMDQDFRSTRHEVGASGPLNKSKCDLGREDSGRAGRRQRPEKEKVVGRAKISFSPVNSVTPSLHGAHYCCSRLLAHQRKAS
jgi:hypothetical protein